MNTETLKTFITLAELKNFTRAAQKHNVVQSTITTRIKELEDDLGVPLFSRNNKSVVITEQGIRFLAYAKQMVECENSARKDLVAENVFNEQVKIGVAHSAYQDLQRLLFGFLESHKNVSLDVRLSDSMQTIWSLTDDQIDLAISYSQFSGSQIICKPLREEGLVLVASHKTALVRTVTIEEFEKLPLAFSVYSVENPPAWYSSIYKDYRRMNFRTNAGSNLVYMLKNGYYYSILPESNVRDELDSGALVRVEIQNQVMPRIRSYVLYKDKAFQKIPHFGELLDTLLKKQLS